MGNLSVENSGEGGGKLVKRRSRLTNYISGISQPEGEPAALLKSDCFRVVVNPGDYSISPRKDAGGSDW